jgi:hypothetical protein
MEELVDRILKQFKETPPTNPFRRVHLVLGGLEDSQELHSFFENREDDSFKGTVDILTDSDISSYKKYLSRVRKNKIHWVELPESRLQPYAIPEFFLDLHKELEKKDAFAVVVTRSLVLIQNTPSRFMTLIETRRRRREIVPIPDHFETLGDSLEAISRCIFGTKFESNIWMIDSDKCVEDGLSLDETKERLGLGSTSISFRSWFSCKEHLHQERKKNA